MSYGKFFSKKLLVTNASELGEIIQPITNYFMGPQKDIAQKFVDSLRKEQPGFMQSVLMGNNSSVLALFLANDAKSPTLISKIADKYVHEFDGVMATLKSANNRIQKDIQENNDPTIVKKLCNEAQKVHDGISKCFNNIYKQFVKLDQEYKLQVPGLKTEPTSVLEQQPRSMSLA